MGRYSYNGKAFRASTAQDRPEEFVQLGLEIFAPGGPTDIVACVLSQRLGQQLMHPAAHQARGRVAVPKQPPHGGVGARHGALAAGLQGRH